VETVLTLTLVALAAAAVAPSAPVAGVWLTEEGDGWVEIRRCGDDLCGTIIRLAEPKTEDGRTKTDIHNPDPVLHDRPIVGLEVLRIDATPDKKGVFREGRIYDPNNGKTYKCKMWLEDPDTLRIRGFIGVSILGRNVIWTRQAAPDPPEAASESRQ
jgi:uncharacterized protein (DUF2147 family)